MNLKDIVFLVGYFLKSIIRKLVLSILSSFGSLWLIIQLGEFFLGQTSQIIINIKSYWFLFLIIGLAIAIKIANPKFTFGCKLTNRDISLEIAIGNLFKQDGALIISSNTTFDTHISKELISERSIQGQFTKKLYFGNEEQLDKEINLELKNMQPEILTDKKLGKNKKYPIGTTIKLTPQNRTIYLVAIVNLLEKAEIKQRKSPQITQIFTDYPGFVTKNLC